MFDDEIYKFLGGLVGAAIVFGIIMFLKFGM